MQELEVWKTDWKVGRKHHEKSQVFTMKGDNKNQLEKAKTFLMLYGKTIERQGLF